MTRAKKNVEEGKGSQLKGGEHMAKPEYASNQDLELKELWFSYRETGDQWIKKELILNHINLVKYVAGRIMVSLPPYLEMDDLISYGTVGLIDAVEGFNPTLGVKFSTYAIARIKGSIYDALRALDWVPRSVREKAKIIGNAMKHLEQEYKRVPNDDELADYLGITREKLDTMLNQVAVPQILSLDYVVFNDDEGKGIDIPTPMDEDPLAIIEQIDLKESLAAAIDRLSERERLIVALYYYEGLTLGEIGKVLELSTARISQLHTKAILRLRTFLKKEDATL